MDNRIEHVVVVMLEGRSFDHLFGLFPGVDGIEGKDLSNLLDPARPAGADNPSFDAGPGAPFRIRRGDGPSSALADTNVQLWNRRAGPASPAPAQPMTGFVRSYRDMFLRAASTSTEELAIAMQCFRPDELPALTALAREFVLCDRWHAEVPGPSLPNRLFMHAATSGGYAADRFGRDFDLETIYEALDGAQKTWAIYYSDANEVAALSRINWRRDRFRVFEERFDADARGGALPNYAFVIPRFASTETAPASAMRAPKDPRPGDALVADVYDALRADDEEWARTLLVVTFADHGGFFDHVAPVERAQSPDFLAWPPDGEDAPFDPAFQFNRLGPRVPAILASPWLPKGRVASNRYQHTSVHATLGALFGTRGPRVGMRRMPKSFADLLQAEPRADTPRTLPRLSPEALADVAGALDESGRKPHEAPPDSFVQALCAGWAVRMQGLAMDAPEGAAPLVPDDGPPRTEAEAGRFLAGSVARFLDERARLHAERAADSAVVVGEPEAAPESASVTAPAGGDTGPRASPTVVPAAVKVGVTLEVTLAVRNR